MSHFDPRLKWESIPEWGLPSVFEKHREASILEWSGMCGDS